MSEYLFTKDWFNWAPQVWEQLTPMLPRVGERSFLEVGSFEGRSMAWIVENMMNPGDELICVDTWKGGEEHGAEDMAAVEARFDHNRSIATSNHDVAVRKYKGTSTEYFASALYEGDDKITFNFIYIDGSHQAPDVLTDACMAWPLLKTGGVMVFDDYLWGNPRDALHRPKIAIDAFTNIFGETVEIVHVGYQLAVRKK